MSNSWLYFCPTILFWHTPCTIILILFRNKITPIYSRADVSRWGMQHAGVRVFDIRHFFESISMSVWPDISHPIQWKGRDKLLRVLYKVIHECRHSFGLQYIIISIIVNIFQLLESTSVISLIFIGKTDAKSWNPLLPPHGKKDYAVKKTRCIVGLGA